MEVLYTSRCAILAFAPNVLFYNWTRKFNNYLFSVEWYLYLILPRYILYMVKILGMFRTIVGCERFELPNFLGVNQMSLTNWTNIPHIKAITENKKINSTIKLIKKNHKLLYGGFEPAIFCVANKLIYLKLLHVFLNLLCGLFFFFQKSGW